MYIYIYLHIQIACVCFFYCVGIMNVGGLFVLQTTKINKTVLGEKLAAV